MKRIAKVMMILLSYAPIGSVAVAAQAKANEIDGEAQTIKIQTAIQAARFRLMPSGETSVSPQQAADRYAAVTGLQGEELQRSMLDDLRLLQFSGYLQVDEANFVSQGPSEKY
jgi:hypothetical protein